ncbi:iron complex transport system substrate-binding protein [Flavobacteriaceae bacterium MAR_2010_188]|nr:iron complex transport system substrate-binding protein [Flavobacteriaceae bacterium MAR_2010_188]
MKILSFFVLFLVISCKSDAKKIEEIPTTVSVENKLDYASGFTFIDNGDIKILEIKNPWPKADKVFKYALINREKAAAITLDRGAYDGIILTPVKSIVVTSTTHLPAIELLGVGNSLVGFPGTDYISSKYFRNRIENNELRELGKNEDINTEVLLDLNPELVVAFGVDGTSKTFDLIKTANIPVIYNGDWVESSPLAKAEWIKFFGILFEKEAQADSIFKNIEAEYLKAKKIAANSGNSPSALSGALHQDVWYLPSGDSPEAQFFKDANIDYLWKDTSAKGSLGLSFEAVLEKAKSAQLWFNPSYYSSLEQLEKSNPHYKEFDAFQNKQVYSFVNKKGATGGVLYYEEAFARPDLVLKDIVKIAHPNLLPNYTPYFFQALD